MTSLKAGVRVPAPGLSAQAMLDRGLAGWLCLGIEPALDCWDGRLAREAMRAARFRVALTAYASPEWQELADVMLPIAAFVEGPGTYVSAEGRWQSFDAAVAPPGEARPAWKVLRVLGNLLGVAGFDYVSAGAIREELRATLGSREAPDSDGRWDVPTGSGLGEGVVRVGEMPAYAVDPLVRRARALQETADAAAPVVRMSPGLATQLGLATGAFARVSQGQGEATLQVVLDERVAEGCAVIPSGIAATAGLGPSIGPVELAKA